jgi:hypothetical protein
MVERTECLGGGEESPEYLNIALRILYLLSCAASIGGIGQ